MTLDACIEWLRGVCGLILDHDTRLEHIRRVSIRNENAVVLHLEGGGFQGGRGAVYKQVALDREVVGKGDGTSHRQGTTDQGGTRHIQEGADARRSLDKHIPIHRSVSMERRELVHKQGRVHRGGALHLERALENRGLCHREGVI